MGLLSNAKFQRVDQMSRKYQEIRDCIHLEHTVSPCWGRFSVGTLTDSLPQDQKISVALRDAIMGTYSTREGVGIHAYLPPKGKSRRGITPRKPESPVRGTNRKSGRFCNIQKENPATCQVCLPPERIMAPPLPLVNTRRRNHVRTS